MLHVGEWEAQNKTHLENDCVAIIEDLDTTVREYTTVGEVLGDWLFVLRVCVLFFLCLYIGTALLHDVDNRNDNFEYDGINTL